jgi:hypothetical protein
MPQVLAAMREEPYWLASCTVEQTPLALWGETTSRWYRRLAPPAPGWGNLRYMRDIAQSPEALDRRAYLALWVLATLHDQPIYAHNVAMAGEKRFGSGLFCEMWQASRRQVRRAIWRRFPRWLARRLARSLA